ncbi:hypothetical protein L9F63_024886, partial [Diploptera punctata]
LNYLNTMAVQTQFFTLNTGQKMPMVGLGTYRVHGQSVIYRVIEAALRAGYRSFDTAAVYRNEEAIGLAFKSLLPKYNLKREDIFLTTKLDPSEHGKGKTTKAVHESLEKLGTSYLDLYLIHWPGCKIACDKSSKCCVTCGNMAGIGFFT